MNKVSVIVFAHIDFGINGTLIKAGKEIK